MRTARPDGIRLAALFVTTLLCLGVNALTWWLWCLLHPRGALELAQAAEAETGEADASAAVVADPTLLEDGVTVVAQVLNGVGEETAMRAYLLMRLQLATDSWGVAILGSSAVFAAYHSHYDAYGITSVFVFGLVFAASCLITRNLWVVALAHAAHNLWNAWT
jgi:membrane protease YdiL (CAAX protease family)